MSKVDVSSDSAVMDSISREKKIVERKLQKFREQLESFEEENGMDTSEFVDKFETGELGDKAKWFDWKFAYEAVQRLEKKEEELKKAYNKW